MQLKSNSIKMSFGNVAYEETDITVGSILKNIDTRNDNNKKT